ncbi:MAG: DNA cytosine methyltransferase [Candidatus Omnitrophica bacterium]|nr:DNA cytosine methyltransferase [Candidatus Omnitrophota bacterium]
MKIFNHIAPKFSELEWEMVSNIPPGGNWKDIPEHVPSKRLEQIRRNGGRTTYYGRLRYDKPSYTISTYFNRIGNGCFIHPKQDRLISIREAARLQSFKDSFVFYGSKTSQYKQVGNAVPPLLARVVANLIEKHLIYKTFIDLFAGAGGMSEGFIMQGYELLGANEIEKNFFETFLKNHTNGIGKNNFIQGDITKEEVKGRIVGIKEKNKLGVVMGGPPCQGFSLAGWRNPKDKRNQLFKEFVHIVDQIRPEFFVIENVPGILTMRGGKTIKEIMSCFVNLGYHVNKPISLKAEEFGVPQLRRRVFLIGSRKKISIDAPKPMFHYVRKRTGLDQSSNSDLPSAITVGEAIKGLPPIKAGEGEFEIKADIDASSAYNKLMTGKDSFSDFYKKILRVKTRRFY